MSVNLACEEKIQAVGQSFSDLKWRIWGCFILKIEINLFLISESFDSNVLTQTDKSKSVSLGGTVTITAQGVQILVLL